MSPDGVEIQPLKASFFIFAVLLILHYKWTKYMLINDINKTLYYIILMFIAMDETKVCIKQIVFFGKYLFQHYLTQTNALFRALKACIMKHSNQSEINILHQINLDFSLSSYNNASISWV